MGVSIKDIKGIMKPDTKKDIIIDLLTSENEWIGSIFKDNYIKFSSIDSVMVNFLGIINTIIMRDQNAKGLNDITYLNGKVKNITYSKESKVLYVYADLLLADYLEHELKYILDHAEIDCVIDSKIQNNIYMLEIMFKDIEIKKLFICDNEKIGFYSHNIDTQRI